MPGNEVGGFNQGYPNEFFYDQGSHQGSGGQAPQDIANRASNLGYGVGVALRKLLEYFNLVQLQRQEQGQDLLANKENYKWRCKKGKFICA